MKPEELTGEFRGGRLVRLSAKSDADRDWLSRYLASIPNGDRLGEIALVDSTSRIGRTVFVESIVYDARAHLLQRPSGRERRGAHGVRLRLRQDAGPSPSAAPGTASTGRERTST